MTRKKLVADPKVNDSKRRVYLITCGLQDRLNEHGPLNAAARAVVDTLGEYEHGSGDVEDVFEKVFPRAWTERWMGSTDCHETCLKFYAAVVEDLALVLQETLPDH